MKGNKLIYMFVCAALAGALAGCTERDLMQRPDNGPLRVNFVWPEGVESSAIGDVTATQLWLYGSDGSLYEVVRAGRDSYEARVPADTYTLLAVNADAVNAAAVSTESASVCRMVASEIDAETLEHVDHVFCGSTTGVVVKPGNIETVATVYPKNAVRYLTFDIDPNYIDDLAGMDMRMTGVVPSVLVANGADAGEPLRSVIAEGQPVDGGHYAASMSVFGWRGQNVLSVIVEYVDGTTEETVPVDISDQLVSLPAEGGSVEVTLTLADGGEITVVATVTPWEAGSGSGTVI